MGCEDDVIQLIERLKQDILNANTKGVANIVYRVEDIRYMVDTLEAANQEINGLYHEIQYGDCQ
jgi:hypothetical protein